jgi:hypothetical protein
MDAETVVALAGVAAVLGGIVVKLTPTKTDDAWWSAIRRAAKKLGKD